MKMCQIGNHLATISNNQKKISIALTNFEWFWKYQLDFKFLRFTIKTIKSMVKNLSYIFEKQLRILKCPPMREGVMHIAFSEATSISFFFCWCCCCFCFCFLILDNLCLLITIGLLNLHYVRSARFCDKFWNIFQNINPCNQRTDKITRHLLEGRAHTRKLVFWSASFLSRVL